MGRPLMPDWFANLVGQIESLSMDSRKDRERLWEVISENMPIRAINDAVTAEITVLVPGYLHDGIRDRIRAVLRSALGAS